MQTTTRTFEVSIVPTKGGSRLEAFNTETGKVMVVPWLTNGWNNGDQIRDRRDWEDFLNGR